MMKSMNKCIEVCAFKSYHKKVGSAQQDARNSLLRRFKTKGIVPLKQNQNVSTITDSGHRNMQKENCRRTPRNDAW